MDRDQREREPTAVGWQPTDQQNEGGEWKLRFVVYFLGLMFLCSLVCVGVGAYYYN